MMFQARFWPAGLSLLAVLATSCVTTPDSYPVPEQHLPFRSTDTEFISAGDPFAQKFFVRDVVPSDGGGWRWTAAEPELRFVLQSTHHRKLLFEFVINERTFRDTGPVKISFFVNKRLIGERRTAVRATKASRNPCPTSGLAERRDRVMARIENPWHTPQGDLGILIKRAGFVQ